MARLIIPFPYIGFHASDGPIVQGNVWVGRQNQNPQQFPIDVTTSAGGSPIAQPIKISAGGVLVSNGTPIDPLVAGANYSIRIEDQDGNLIYQDLDVNSQALTGDFGTAATRNVGTANDNLATIAQINALIAMSLPGALMIGTEPGNVLGVGTLGFGGRLSEQLNPWPIANPLRSLNANPQTGIYYHDGNNIDASYPFELNTGCIIFHRSLTPGNTPGNSATADPQVGQYEQVAVEIFQNANPSTNGAPSIGQISGARIARRSSVLFSQTTPSTSQANAPWIFDPIHVRASIDITQTAAARQVISIRDVLRGTGTGVRTLTRLFTDEQIGSTNGIIPALASSASTAHYRLDHESPAITNGGRGRVGYVVFGGFNRGTGQGEPDTLDDFVDFGIVDSWSSQGANNNEPAVIVQVGGSGPWPVSTNSNGNPFQSQAFNARIMGSSFNAQPGPPASGTTIPAILSMTIMHTKPAE